jgi:hypothetical protein
MAEHDAVAGLGHVPPLWNAGLRLTVPVPAILKDNVLVVGGGPDCPDTISKPRAPAFALVQVALIDGWLVALSAARSAAGLSADACSASAPNPAPGVTAGALFATPNTPNAALLTLANAPRPTVRPVEASP